MKAPLIYLLVVLASVRLPAQAPFSSDDALKQLYHDYDATKKSAHWACAKEKQAKDQDELCQYFEGGNFPEDTTVSVSVLLVAQVAEGDATRVYLATSAKPNRLPGEFDCHACRPAIGAAVFIWQGQSWTMESSGTAIEFSGGWGGPPSVDLIEVGPDKHGLLLSSDDEGQGFSSSSKELLIPIGKNVENVWSIQDEHDDIDAIDPHDKANSPPLYHSSAGIRLFSDEVRVPKVDDYYKIEVISRGTSLQDWGHLVKPENWTEVYEFKDGKFKLVRRTVFEEINPVNRPKAK